MNMRTRLVGSALAGLLLFSGGSVMAGPGTTPEAACFGQHVSTIANDHGGMANATAHHNGTHGSDLTVGEHQAHMRAMGCEMSME